MALRAPGFPGSGRRQGLRGVRRPHLGFRAPGLAPGQFPRDAGELALGVDRVHRRQHEDIPRSAMEALHVAVARP
jgi:hypothetical protein